MFVFGLTISQISAEQASEYRKADRDKIEYAYERTRQDIEEAAHKVILGVTGQLIAELGVTPDDTSVLSMLTPKEKAVTEYLADAAKELEEKFNGVKEACLLVTDKDDTHVKEICDERMKAFKIALREINGGIYLN